MNGIRSGSPIVAQRRRSSSSKRNSTGSAIVPAGPGGGIIEEEDEEIEDVAEFSPTVGEGVEIEFERYEDSENGDKPFGAVLSVTESVQSALAGQYGMSIIGDEQRGRSKERLPIAWSLLLLFFIHHHLLLFAF